MKNVLIVVAIVCLLAVSGSVAYYYLVLLPQQNSKTAEDIGAIKSVVAPSDEQQKATMDAYNAYMSCEVDMSKKGDAWLQQKCDIPYANDLLKAMDCRSKALASSEYQSQFSCKQPQI